MAAKLIAIRSRARLKRTSILSSGLLLNLFFANPLFAQDYSYEEGTLLSGETSMQFEAVSNDGSIVVGTTYGAGIPRPMQWSNGTGAEVLPLFSDGYYGRAYDVSGDGSIIVGYSGGANSRATRWTSSGIEDLGALSGHSSSEANAISSDGSTIVGFSAVGAPKRAFRFTDATGMVDLGVLAGSSASEATDASADGSVVVGNLEGTTDQAFYWTDSGGIVGLGNYVAAPFPVSTAAGVSGDGNVVVGTSRDSTGIPVPVKWDIGAGTFVNLGDLPGGSGGSAHQGGANAASFDGDVVVGYSTSGDGVTAFYWTATDGIQDFNALLEAEGVDLTGIHLRWINDTNDDGTIVVGETGAGAPFIALYGHEAGMLDPNDATESVYEVSNVGFLGAKVGQQLNGDLTHVALNFDFAAPNEYSSRGDGSGAVQWGAYVLGQTLLGPDGINGGTGGGSVGIMGKAQSGLKFGVGLDAVRYSLSGSADQSSATVRGAGLSAFVSFDVGNNFVLAATAAYTDYSADISRRYLNGAAIETSYGTTDGNYSGAELTLAYTHEVSDTMKIRPYVSVQSGTASFDAYTETGGTFFGDMSAQSTTLRAVRVGADLTHRISSETTLLAGVEIAQVSEKTNATTLSVTNLSGVSFGGANSSADYEIGTLSFGLSHRLSPSTAIYGNLEVRSALGSTVDDRDTLRGMLGFNKEF